MVKRNLTLLYLYTLKNNFSSLDKNMTKTAHFIILIFILELIYGKNKEIICEKIYKNFKHYKI